MSTTTPTNGSVADGLHVDLGREFKRAAVAYGVLSGAVATLPVPLRVSLTMRWEYGSAVIELGDARTARTVAALFGLRPAVEQSTTLRHVWSGVYADLPVIVVGSGRLDADAGRGLARGDARVRRDFGDLMGDLFDGRA